jgi:hypothetical protein
MKISGIEITSGEIDFNGKIFNNLNYTDNKITTLSGIVNINSNNISILSGIIILKTDKYIHAQTPVNNVWDINHNLNTTNIISATYGIDDVSISSSGVIIIDQNNIQIIFLTALNGKAVIIG